MVGQFRRKFEKHSSEIEIFVENGNFMKFLEQIVRNHGRKFWHLFTRPITGDKVLPKHPYELLKNGNLRPNTKITIEYG